MKKGAGKSTAHAAI